VAVGVAASSQPTGIFNASGIGSVSSTGGAGAAPQITDYEKLMFAISKAYRVSGSALNPCYIANDTTYQRARSIAVGSSDARRIFGMDHSNYTLLDHPYRVQPDIPNAKIAFGALKLYRMYRREGIEMRWEEGGESLARSNQALLIVRARLGGQVVDASAFAAITDAQS
jgi:HK97 family phage major capsid protein